MCCNDPLASALNETLYINSTSLEDFTSLNEENKNEGNHITVTINLSAD